MSIDAPFATVPAAPRRAVLVCLSLAVLLPSMAASSANVALPTLSAVFDTNFQAVQWVVLAYLLAMTTLIVSVGRLGDLLGPRRLLLAGIGVFTVCSALCGLAPSLPLLVAARFGQGLGAAAMMALTMALVSQAVPKERTGRAMGLLATMSAVGTALGPSLGGALIALFDWRYLFLINVPLGIATYLLARASLPHDVPRQSGATARFDGVGTVLLAGTLLAYTLAVTLGRGHAGPINAALLAASAAGAALFVYSQQRVAYPLISLSLFRDARFSTSLATSTMVSTVMMTTMVVGPFYLARSCALSPAMVGLAMSCGPIAAALAGVPAGRLADRFGTQRMVNMALLLIAGGAALLALLPANLGVAGYAGSLVVMTIGFALFQTANNTSVLAHAPATRKGAMSGLLNLSRHLGFVTGASVMGAVFAFGANSANPATAAPESVAAGMRLTFGLACICMLCSLLLNRAPGKGEPSSCAQ